MSEKYTGYLNGNAADRTTLCVWFMHTTNTLSVMWVRFGGVHANVCHSTLTLGGARWRNIK